MSVAPSASGSNRSTRKERVMRKSAVVLVVAMAAGCGAGDGPTSPSGGPPMSFFVSSVTSVTGNIGGLAGADALCTRLGSAVGQGNGRLWRAFLRVRGGGTDGN